MIDRKKVYDKYDGHCAYCGCELDFKDMQVDHARPKMHYNAETRTYFHVRNYIDGIMSVKIEQIKEFLIDGIDNLMPSCRKCNHYKRSADIEEFRLQIESLIYRLRKDYINEVAEKFGIYQYHEWDNKFYFEKVKEGLIK